MDGIGDIVMIDSSIPKPDENISADDTMYEGNTTHYFSVGRSALKAIIQILNVAGQETIRSVLDLPCGHGRVLRYLRAKFPHASITACDIDRPGVDFCVNTFNAAGLYSQKNIAQVDLGGKYDLIWCGSLLTHLDKGMWGIFIESFSQHLAPHGILVFTTHGRSCIRLLEEHQTYGLNEKKVPALLIHYKETGFGYANYDHESEYGISMSSPAWVLAELQRHPDLKIIFCLEAGWDDHQDVIACMRRA